MWGDLILRFNYSLYLLGRYITRSVAVLSLWISTTHNYSNELYYYVRVKHTDLSEGLQ
jgi:hypothetical protein